MALTTDTADQVVEAVADDLLSCSRIEGPTLGGILSAFHIAGHVRNFALILGGMDKDDSHFVRVCCIGIAEATSKAIFSAIRSGDIPAAKTTCSVYRVVHQFPHFGTRVSMKDGTDYVFDWFPTLEPWNPLIYQYANWKKDAGAVEYDDFEGFDSFTGW